MLLLSLFFALVNVIVVFNAVAIFVVDDVAVVIVGFCNMSRNAITFGLILLNNVDAW